MPEDPCIKVWEDRLRQWTKRVKTARGSPPQGFLVLYPRSFGAVFGGKSRTACTVSNLGYTEALDAFHCVKTEPSSFDLADMAGNSTKHEKTERLSTSIVFPEFLRPSLRDVSCAADNPFQYLLKPRRVAAISFATRGKQLALAVGHHLMVVTFGAEAGLMKLPLATFKDIISASNQDNHEMTQTFQLPAEFCNGASRATPSKRTASIIAAVVSDDSVWAVVDCETTHPSRLHIISHSECWQQSELTAGTPTWSLMWDHAKYGPDWISEKALALDGVQRWRQDILRREPGSESTKAIVAALHDNNLIFNGFGPQTSSDVLAPLGIHPLMPCFSLCDDADLFLRFCRGLLGYTAQWASKEFLRWIGAREMNSVGPFNFYAAADSRYFSHYVTVYQKTDAQVLAELYDRMRVHGLFDPDHTLGNVYIPSTDARTLPPAEPGDKFKIMPVWRYAVDNVTAYSAIAANPPLQWGMDGRFTKSQVGAVNPTQGNVKLEQDASSNTEQAQHVGNKDLGYSENGEFKGRAGRRVVIKTGKPGHPRKPMKASERRAIAKKASMSRAARVRSPSPGSESARSDDSEQSEPLRKVHKAKQERTSATPDTSVAQASEAIAQATDEPMPKRKYNKNTGNMGLGRLERPPSPKRPRLASRQATEKIAVNYTVTRNTSARAIGWI